MVLDGWELSGVTLLQSGTPFTVINSAGNTGISLTDNAGVSSGLGIAAMTGVLPNSHGYTAQSTQTPTVAEPVQPKAVPHNTVLHAAARTQPMTTGQVARNEPAAPAAPAAKPAPHNSPIGIGVGAVIGGVLGNQVGSGDGKTLATIAGAIGGGYIGNEVAKKNQ